MTRGRFTLLREVNKGSQKASAVWVVKCSCGRVSQKSWTQIKATCLRACRCEQLEKADKVKAWLIKHHDEYTTLEAAEKWGMTKAPITMHCKRLGIKMMAAPPQIALSQSQKAEKYRALALRAKLPAFLKVFTGEPTGDARTGL